MYPIRLGSATFTEATGYEAASFTAYSPDEFRLARDVGVRRWIAPNTIVYVVLSHDQWHIIGTLDDNRLTDCVWVTVTHANLAPFTKYKAAWLTGSPSDDDQEFGVYTYSTYPDHTQRFGILLADADYTGNIVPLQVRGVCPAYVNVLSDAHTRASFKGDSENLISDMYGPVGIVSKPTGTGVKLCKVILDAAPVTMFGRVVAAITSGGANGAYTEFSLGSGVIEVWRTATDANPLTGPYVKVTDTGGNRVLHTVYNRVKGDPIPVNSYVTCQTMTEDQRPIVYLADCEAPAGGGTGSGGGGGGTTPSSVTLYPTGWEPNSSGSGEATWSGNQDAAQDDDGDYAATTLQTSGTTQRSFKAGFGSWVDSMAAAPAIPAAAVIAGFSITVRAFQTVGADAVLSEINLYFGATTKAVATSVALSATETAYSYGSASSLFGFAPTPTDINDNNWGIELEVFNGGGR